MKNIWNSFILINQMDIEISNPKNPQTVLEIPRS